MAEPQYTLPRPAIEEHLFLFAIVIELQHLHNVLDEIKVALQQPSPHPHADVVELREPEPKPKPKRGDA